ncbi:MAG: hypothetical protein HY228_01705 [Candidatus Yonathbacteria bacterium]|nr:hypothetical protein [Candidatus Yonathbacteria bacterium]
MKSSRLFLFFILLASPAFVPLWGATSTTPTLEEMQQQMMDDTAKSGIGSLLDLNKIRGNSIAEYLNVRIAPQNPKPGEQVRVSIESYLTDLNKATIKWTVDGKTISQGIGYTSFSFPVSSSGGSTKLTISITTNAGDEVTREFSFNPVGLTVLWEADTYTPPFYKGKPLITYQASVRAIAIPNETNTKNALDAETLAYVWKQDGTASENTSGYGKNSFIFTAPRPYERTKVSVGASSLNNTINSEFKLAIPVANPFILFHEDHPLLGIWYNRPLGKELSLTKKEFSLRAEPYFFSKEIRGQSSLVYNWDLNGQAVNNPGLLITLRNEAGTKGDSSLSFAMSGRQKTFQTADQSLLIHFTAEEGSSGF